MSRWLRRFGPRLEKQLNIVAGAVGVGAFLLGGAALVPAGDLQNGLIIAGVVVASVMLLIAVIRAWPPADLTPSQAAKMGDVPIAELPAIHPTVLAVGILGPGGVGKTTLKNRLLQESTENVTRTQRITFHVSPLIREAETFLAIVDGGGEMYSQQFNVADHANIIFVLLDHNDIETPSPNADRLALHRTFGVQIREHLKSHSSYTGPVHVLLNKKDLWSQATDDEQAHLRAFFQDEISQWKTAFGIEKVTSAEHSNDVGDDIAAIVSKIQEQSQGLGETARR